MGTMKYSKTVVTLVLDGLRQGLPQKVAAQRAGVSEDTVSLWKAKKPEFRRAVEVAQAEFCGRNLRIIQGAAEEKNKWGQSQWQASAWLLERRWPELFGLRHPEPEPGAVNVQIVLSGGRRVLNIPSRSAKLPEDTTQEIEVPSNSTKLPDVAPDARHSDG
jgi:hypothetical protein